MIKQKPQDLDNNAIAPQAIDNQWVSREMLREMMRNGKKLEDVTAERELAVVKEWRRALVYAPQVLLNRAYLYNNHVVAEDYVNTASREAFETLLNTQVIVLSLFTEDDPTVKPAFGVIPEFWDAWLDVVKETDVTCMRTSWDDAKQEISNLAVPFHEYIQSLNMPERTRHLADAFGLPEEQREGFRQRLVELAEEAFTVASSGKTITRNHIYQEFVCVDGTNTADGIYDPNKPFSAQIKQIVDLRYNVNMPDVYGCFALTPKNSPPRTALGDMQEIIREIIEEEELIELVASLIDMKMSMLSEPIDCIEGLHHLTLDDVLQARDFDEWKIYDKGVDQLLEQPNKVPTLCKKVFNPFVQLNQEITKLKDGDPTAPWRPMVQFALTIGGKTLRIAPNPEHPTEKLVLEEKGFVDPGNEPLLLQMVISGASNAGADLDLGLDFLRGMVRNGRDTWNELLGILVNKPDIRVVDHWFEEKEEANQSQPERQEEQKAD